MAMSKKEAVDALLKEEAKEGRPSWKYRRRLIFGSFYLAAFMIIFAAGTFFVDSRVSSELVIGGVSLISIILTAYIAGATIEDIKLWHSPESKEKTDGEELY